jgi:hypothetical protein
LTPGGRVAVQCYQCSHRSVCCSMVGPVPATYQGSECGLACSRVFTMCCTIVRLDPLP